MFFNDTNIDLENPERRKCDPDSDSFKARILRKCKAAQNRLKQEFQKTVVEKGEIWMFELY
jgi:CRISPR/Cas system CMR subunit Cmr4 (Cas7 group RAMP superfamily)